MSKKKKTYRETSCHQTLITLSESSFNSDLCKTLSSANIPLNKLSQSTFRNFLVKYTDTRPINIKQNICKQMLRRHLVRTFIHIKGSGVGVFSSINLGGCSGACRRTEAWLPHSRKWVGMVKIHQVTINSDGVCCIWYWCT